MAFFYTEGTATIGTTEYSCPNASTTLTPQTTEGYLMAVLDVAAMVAGDQYQIRIYEKCRSSSTQRLAYQSVLTGAQTDPLWLCPGVHVKHGWDVTLKKLAGTDRAFEWSLRRTA